MTITTATVKAVAIAGYKAGLSLIPAREDGTKAPDVTSWKQYQTEQPSRDQMRTWFNQDRTGLILVCGYDDVEALDFDRRDLYQTFCDTADAAGLGELVERIRAGYEEWTPEGVHWLYRCAETKSGKLARRESGEVDERGNPIIETLIETKGKGGYVVIAPSHGRVHPSGQPYELRRGGFDSFVTITPEERAALFELAEALDELEKPEWSGGTHKTAHNPDDRRPGDEYNQRGPAWPEILAGWTLVRRHGEIEYWRRPGKQIGISATINGPGIGPDRLYVFTTSTVFEAGRSYSKFQAYCVLEHGGDFGSAASDLARHGYSVDYMGTTFVLPDEAAGGVEIVPNGKHEPEPELEAIWRLPKGAQQIDIHALPYWLNRIVRHIEPFTPMFPPEWAVMMALPFWSMLWPQVRVQNLNLALWTLGIGRQGGGKNIATDELERLTKIICQGDITTYTAGSPEGLWEALEGNGKRVLAYHDEYAGLLKLFSRDHMSHAKEALCSLYDGRGVGYLRSKGKSVQIDDPVLAVVATTTPSALREFGNLSDLTNGYLSRFMVCAPDRRNVSPDFSLTNEAERRQLAQDIALFRSEIRGVVRVEYAETGRPDPPTLNAYRSELGIDTGEIETLEDALDDQSIPGGRLLARVKKVAGLLALAERPPATQPGGQTVLIQESHIQQAIAIVELGYAYAERVLRWIGESQDVQLSGRVLALLRAHPAGLSRRDVCRRLNVRAAEVQDALRLLREEGAVLATKTEGRGGEKWVALKVDVS